LRQDKRKALAFAAASGVLVVLGYLAAGGTAALKPLRHTAQFVSYHSFWYPIERLFGLTSSRMASVALIVVVVLAVVIALRRARDHGPAPVVAAALSVYVLAAPYILPWYTAPVIPLLALYHRARTTWLILSYSMLLYLVYPARFPAHHTFATLILPELARN